MGTISLPRSERELYNAFFSLIRAKSAYKITVRDLVEKAGLNRSTFYRHYEDMPQFLNRVAEHYVDSLIDACSSVQARKNQMGSYVQWCRQFYTYRKEYSLLLSDNGVIGFRKKLLDRGIEMYRSKLLYISNPAERAIDSETLSVYVVSAHIGLTEYWLAQGCRESPEEMASKMTVLSIEGAFRAAGVGNNVEYPA